MFKMKNMGRNAFISLHVDKLNKDLLYLSYMLIECKVTLFSFQLIGSVRVWKSPKHTWSHNIIKQTESLEKQSRQKKDKSKLYKK